MDIYFVSWHIKRIYETAGGRWTDEADSKRLMLDEAIHPLLQWPGARDTCRSSSNHSHVLSLSTNESQVFTCHHWQLRMLGLAWPRLLTSAHLASLRCIKLLICQQSRSIIYVSGFKIILPSHTNVHSCPAVHTATSTCKGKLKLMTWEYLDNDNWDGVWPWLNIYSIIM